MNKINKLCHRIEALFNESFVSRKDAQLLNDVIATLREQSSRIGSLERQIEQIKNIDMRIFWGQK